MLQFRVDGMPESKGSWRYAGHSRRTGKPRLISDNEAEPAWAEQVAWACRAALGHPPKPDKRAYQVALDFTLRAPAGRGGRQNRRDIDKLARSVLDALTGIVWADDEQVVRLVLDRGVTGVDGRGLPGLSATIESWDAGSRLLGNVAVARFVPAL